MAFCDGQNDIPYVKKLLLLLACCELVFQSARAAQTLPAYESFPTNYANNARLADIAALDAGNGAGSGSNLTNSWSAGLSYLGLVTSNGSGGVIANGTPGSGRDRGFQFNPAVAWVTDGDNLYASFLLKIQTPTTTTNLIALLATGTGGGSTPAAGVYLDQNNKLWISKNSATPVTNTASALSVGNTHLIVFRYHYNEDSPDSVALWVDPVSLGAGEANVPGPTLVTFSGSDASSVAAFDFAHRTGNFGASGFKYFDEARVATTWAGVTPTTNVVVAPSNQPYITQTLLVAGGLELRGTNGPANEVYRVLGSGNIVQPPGQWPVLATNAFDANGNFDCTNPLPAGAVQFYRLLVGGQIMTSSVAPFIVTQPTNQTVMVSNSAAFNVGADGTGPLRYQWYFNTNTPLPNATNATLALTNVQLDDAGAYSVLVTNIAGATNSGFAILTVNAAPKITAGPQSQTVVVSNNATFSVTATGTALLRYQWYFNTNTPLGNATNFSLTLTNVQATNAGGYSVRVTNDFGAVTSSVAQLTVTLSNNTPDFSMIGFATLPGYPTNLDGSASGTYLPGGTTGGAAGSNVQVWTASDFAKHVQTNSSPLMVEVMTNIDLGIASLSGDIAQPTYSNFIAARVLVNNNKTIYSRNGSTLSHGTLQLGKGPNGKQNVIIRNLKFRDLWEYDPSGNYDSKQWDYISIESGSHHVWVDHCDFDRVYDGMVDITHGSDFVTVSWNVFRNQKKCSLVGHSDSSSAQAEDTGHLNVTFHHNYYTNVDERMPRMRFGNAHVFNLYCEDLGGNGIQSTADAATLVENSYFYHPAAGSLPTREENGGPTGIVKVVNSTIVNLPGNNVQFRQFGQTDFMFNAPYVGVVPPYAYTNIMDALANVPNVVTNWAGVGKITDF